jgi:hypothetical protein
MRADAGVLGVMAALWLACQCGGAPPPPPCTINQCLRAIRCVSACGSDPVQIGCCACPMGTFDDLSCAADAGDGG